MSISDSGLGSIEITSKAWAAVLGLGVAATVDMEGLLFGRPKVSPPGIVIEGVLLTGAAWSIAAPQAEELSEKATELIRQKGISGQKLLGWCSLRRSREGLAQQEGVDKRLSVRELRLHQVVATRCEAGIALGCVVVERATVDTGIFHQEAYCFLGPELKKARLSIRNIGATKAASDVPPLLPGGLFQAVSGMEQHFVKAAKAVEAAVSEGLRRLDFSKLHEPGLALHASQRAALLPEAPQEWQRRSRSRSRGRAST